MTQKRQKENRILDIHSDNNGRREEDRPRLVPNGTEPLRILSSLSIPVFDMFLVLVLLLLPVSLSLRTYYGQ